MKRTEFRRKMYDALFAQDIEIERIWWDGDDKADQRKETESIWQLCDKITELTMDDNG